MKRTLFISCLFLVLCITANAQQYFINSGSTGNSIPFGGSSWADQRCQFLYIPGEFGTVPAGLITTVYFRSSGSAASTYTNLQIDIGQSTIISLPGTSWVGGLTTAMTASTYSVSPTVGGWVAYPLQTPIMFDPTLSLVVDTRQTATSGGYAIYTASATGTRRQYAASAAGAPTGSSATRYDFGFDLITCQAVTNVAASNITVTGATLTWTGVTGSLGYERVLNQTASSPTGSGTFNATTSYTATGLALNTTYYMHVRNICSNGYSPWVNYAFTTLNAYCLPPTNILFTNVTETSVDLLWSKMPTSDSYEYKVDLTPTAPLNSNNTIKTTGITAHVGGLQPNTKYYVYMRSICLGGADSSYWKKDSFVTKAYCGIPEVTVTGAGTNTPSAAWPAIATAVAYEYAVTSSAADPAFGTEIYAPNVDISLDLDGKDKYLHVRTKCNSQFLFSSWTNDPLRVTPSNINDVDNDIFTVYPNPATSVLVLNIAGNVAAGKGVVITDMSGRILKRASILGTKTYIDVKDLATGSYIIKYSETGRASQVIFQKL